MYEARYGNEILDVKSVYLFQSEIRVRVFLNTGLDQGQVELDRRLKDKYLNKFEILWVGTCEKREDHILGRIISWTEHKLTRQDDKKLLERELEKWSYDIVDWWWFSKRKDVSRRMSDPELTDEDAVIRVRRCWRHRLQERPQKVNMYTVSDWRYWKKRGDRRRETTLCMDRVYSYISVKITTVWLFNNYRGHSWIHM